MLLSVLKSSPLFPYQIHDFSEKVFSKYLRYCPLRISSERRCWGCHKFSKILLPCPKCQVTRYCSPECQEKHFSSVRWQCLYCYYEKDCDRSIFQESKQIDDPSLNRRKECHKQVCRSSLFYDQTKWAQIILPDLSFKDPGKILTTALHLIDQSKIHPDKIRLTTISDRDHSEGLFKLSRRINLLPFLERGLTPQEVVDHEDFKSCESRIETNNNVILEYGTGEVNFPRQNYQGPIGYLIGLGGDPEEIMDSDSVYGQFNPINMAYLAIAGYDFHVTPIRFPPERMISRLNIIRSKDPCLAEKIEKLLEVRDTIIRMMIFELFIPDLGNIVLGYL